MNYFWVIKHELAFDSCHMAERNLNNKTVFSTEYFPVP